MSNLIAMTCPKGFIRREPFQGGTADILFFTGVRYERMPETDLPTTTALARATPKPRKPSNRGAQKRA